MSEIKNGFLDLVGQTPLVRLNNLIKKEGLEADVLARSEEHTSELQSPC